MFRQQSLCILQHNLPWGFVVYDHLLFFMSWYCLDAQQFDQPILLPQNRLVGSRDRPVLMAMTCEAIKIDLNRLQYDVGLV